jgi:hypothetical protein
MMRAVETFVRVTVITDSLRKESYCFRQADIPNAVDILVMFLVVDLNKSEYDPTTMK